ncbi:cobalamin synthesis protein [Escherichia coli]|uniref:Cobalamin synthesis protein n=1 Tax=Escherichia coli TaxID=562 RepID=A0A377CC17_ECOLX|nr:cobalamin synthesis protein [Escherichia coli]
MDLHIETQNVAPPDSRIELISSSEADWNALQSALLKLRFSDYRVRLPAFFSKIIRENMI